MLLTSRTHEFVDEILLPCYGGIMMFVKEAEAAIERGNIEPLKNQERE